MTVESAFDRKRAVFLDSAPVIYTLGVHPEWSRKATAARGLSLGLGTTLKDQQINTF